MTRKEYMDELARALDFMAEEPRQALLDFYGEMLADRMEDGMDEASAVAAMESPAEIAARQRAEGNASSLNEKGPGAAKEETSAGEGDFMTNEAMKFSSLAGQLLRTFEDLEKAPPMPPVPPEKPETQDAPETPEPPKKADIPDIPDIPEIPEIPDIPDIPDISEIPGVSDALKAAKDSIQSAKEYIQAHAKEENTGEYVKKTLTCPVDRLRAVKLMCGEMPIRVEACPGDTATLTYYTSEWDPYVAEVNDGELTLEKAGQGKGGRRFSFSMLGGIIRIGWNTPAPTVELLLPPDALVDLLAHASNASIKLSGLQALCDVELKTSNSRIELSRLSCKALAAKTSNARIVLEDAESRLAFDCKTSNGRIEGKNIRSGRDLTLTTSNGRVTVDGASSRGEMRLTTSNGRIEVARLQAEALGLKTSNSSISGVLPGARGDWAIQSGTSNGKNSLPAQQPGAKPLSVHTSNGSISLRFEAEG